MTARRLLLLLGTLAAALLLSAAPAAAQNYTGDAEVVVDDATIAPGGVVTFAGDGFASFCPLAISVDANRVGTETADRGGAFSTDVTLNEPGTHTLAAQGCGERATLEVEVLEAAAGGGLPVTGFSPIVFYLAGALLLTGTVLIAVARQRRRDTAQV